MKNAYINNVPVRHGEISVVISAHAGGTIKSTTQIQNSTMRYYQANGMRFGRIITIYCNE